MRALFTSLLIVLSCFANAQQWKQLTHSYGSTSSALQFEANGTGKIYLLSDEGWIYFSSNDGLNWEPLIDVPSFFNVTSFFVSDQTNRLFTNTLYSGVGYTDDGINWHFDNLVTNPHTGLGLTTYIVCASGNKVHAIAQAGFETVIFSSVLNGSFGSWSHTHTLTQSVLLNSFKYIDNTNVAISTKGGLYFSDDSGTSFEWITFFSGKDVRDVVRSLNGKLYAAVSNQNGNTGELYESADNGVSWALTGTIPGNEILGFVTSQTTEDLFVSTNQGVFQKHSSQHWNSLTNSGVFTSIFLSNAGYLYISGENVIGMQRSSLSSPEVFTTISIENTEPSVAKVFAGNSYLLGSPSKSLVSMVNVENNQWTTLNLLDYLPGLESTGVSKMLSVSNGDVIMAGGEYIGKLNSGTNEFEVIATAASIPPGGNLFIADLAYGNQEKLIFLRSTFNDYFQYKENDSENWTTVSPGDSLANPISIFINDIAASDDFTYVLATTSTSKKILKSSDFSNWQLIDMPNGGAISAITTDLNGDLYGWFTGLDIYKYESTTNSWTEIPFGIANQLVDYSELAFDMSNTPYLLQYGTMQNDPGNGIFIWNSNSQSWQNIGFPVVNGKRIAISNLGFTSDNIPIGFATNALGLLTQQQKGIYYFSDMTLDLQPGYPQANQSKVYPNPSSSQVNIEGGNFLNYILYSPYGQQLKEGRLTTDNTIIDINMLPSGNYFIRVFNDDTSETIKIVKQ